MKEILQQYASYNLWANQRMVDVILSVSPELYMKQVASSFNSLQLTLKHVGFAENTWFTRVSGGEVAATVEDPSMNEIATGLLAASKKWVDWVEKSTGDSLRDVCSYQNLKKEPFEQPVFQILLQVFNHATYHRGQMVTMLRQLGVEVIPPTDFIVWSRTKSKDDQ